MAPSLIAAIVLTMWLSTTRPSASAPSTAAAFAWLAAEAVVLLAISRFVSVRVRSLADGDWTHDARARRLFHQASRVSTLLTFLAFTWLLLGAGWLDLVRRETSQFGSSLLEQAALLAPYFLFELIVGWGLISGERALDGSAPGRFVENVRALLRQARQQWGLLLPVLVFLLLMQDILAYVRPGWSADVLAQTILMTVLGLVVAAFAPHLLRFAWTTRPLPPGPLRDRLEAIARRHRFRFRAILVWDTNQRIVNAVVTGILPWSRYVLLSDALIARLDQAEIEAIFGHEVGHVAHRHLAFLGFFAVATLAVVATAGDWAASSIPWTLPGGLAGEAIRGIVLLVIVVGVFFVAFGFVSRRFELQADLFGCRVASESAGMPAGLDVATFARALQLTALFNGIDPNRPSWRHGSIQDRIAFLHALAADPAAEQTFQARIRRTRRIILALLLLGLTGCGLLLISPH